MLIDGVNCVVFIWSLKSVSVVTQLGSDAVHSAVVLVDWAQLLLQVINATDALSLPIVRVG